MSSFCGDACHSIRTAASYQQLPRVPYPWKWRASPAHAKRLTPHVVLAADAVWCPARRSTVAPVQGNPDKMLVVSQSSKSDHELPPSPSPNTTFMLREPSPDLPRARTCSPTPPTVQAQPTEIQLPGTPFRDESDKQPPPTNGRDSPSLSAEPGSGLSPAQGVPTETPHQLSVQTHVSVLRTAACNNSASVASVTGDFTNNRGGSPPGTPQGCASELRRPTLKVKYCILD